MPNHFQNHMEHLKSGMKFMKNVIVKLFKSLGNI